MGVRGREACASIAAADPHLDPYLAACDRLLPLSGGIKNSPPLQGRNKVYIERLLRPEESPKPSIRASVPSSDDSRALTSSNRV